MFFFFNCKMSYLFKVNILILIIVINYKCLKINCSKLLPSAFLLRSPRNLPLNSGQSKNWDEKLAIVLESLDDGTQFPHAVDKIIRIVEVLTKRLINAEGKLVKLQDLTMADEVHKKELIEKNKNFTDKINYLEGMISNMQIKIGNLHNDREVSEVKNNIRIEHLMEKNKILTDKVNYLEANNSNMLYKISKWEQNADEAEVKQNFKMEQLIEKNKIITDKVNEIDAKTLNIPLELNISKTKYQDLQKNLTELNFIHQDDVKNLAIEIDQLKESNNQNTLMFSNYKNLINDISKNKEKWATETVSTWQKLLISSLSKAIKQHQSHLIYFILNLGVDVNLHNVYGSTPLNSAAWEGDVNVIKEIIKHGADIEKQSTDTRTPLYLAVQSGKLDAVKELIRQGADIQKKANSNWSPLHLAAKKGYLNLILELIKHGANIESKTNQNGRTPLHSAAEDGQLDSVKELIKQGANIHSKDKHGQTLLDIAIWYGRSDVVKFIKQKQ